MTALLAGLLTGLSLIVAIGAQNAYVLRQGLSRNHIGVVVAICTFADAVLIMAGVSGVGAIIECNSTALSVLVWIGATYLVGFGLLSLWRARKPQSLRPAPENGRGRAAVIAATLALTFLNPHVYLDTVLMLGSIANQYGAQGRWWFGGGAVAGSVIWFTGLGYGARAAADVVARPLTWGILDTVIGIVMILLAVKLILM
ncbi:LysE/ArgO family amino acid transporter [Antrihabitans cavernicola]|uniref:Amino acid transporter n=1 Tax=Antrihabitans cavernicola TaxID=2495913 RepID=A0A5A7SCX8_9NOCA|nr:LysE/ArgO family amino acid transporter [Spelaeibacter cavernicola]KAA0023414.1 amino acid transporter [Spelaeibacter cavernicola]